MFIYVVFVKHYDANVLPFVKRVLNKKTPLVRAVERLTSKISSPLWPQTIFYRTNTEQTAVPAKIICV